jgi:hypothetical protein
MDQAKLDFIRYELLPLLKSLPPGATGNWGKMNGQQMVEHVADFFRVSSGKLTFPLVTPVEQLPKYKEFLLSDKPFRENTKAPEEVVPAEPLPLRNETMSEALNELKKTVEDFTVLFENGTLVTTSHPVFGELNYEEWVLLNYKHVTHHLKQFALL